MAASTVIDQLIVKLGLDPRDFTKGQKQIAGEMIKTEGTVKKSSENMGRSLLGFTGKLLGVATAAVAVKKAISYVSDLSTSVRQLGIDSRNFTMAANEMRNFQNVSEMMGGKAEDATKTIGSLTKAVYDLAYNGQISDSLIMLGRLGVQFQDTAGNAKDFKAIVLDTQTAIQRSMKSGTSYANANQMLLQAGFDPGLAQAMLKNQVGPLLAQQQGRRQVTNETVSSATAWEQSATNRDQAIAAASLRGLPVEAAVGTAANNAIAKGADYAGTASAADAFKGSLKGITAVSETAARGVNKVVGALEHLGAKASDSFDDMVRSLHHFPRGRVAYEGTIQDAAKRAGIDPEMLASIIGTESDFDPYAKSKAGALGIAQLMPKYFPDAGKSPRHDIYTAATHLRGLKDSFAKEGYSEDDQYIMALRSYNAGQSRVKNSMLPGGKPLAQETIDYPGKVLAHLNAMPSPGAMGSMSGGSNHTEVNIGDVTVNTQATDADGIASDFADATKRKMNAAQADAGMQ